jgi:3-hydroxyisobutyrate dehydrogenase
MTARPGHTRVGFIGVGLMGGPMAGHVLAAGYELHVYNRTRPKAEALLARGATWHDDPASLARACDVVLTIVGFPKDVDEVYFGDSGIIAAANPGASVVDMTTASPAMARRIADAAKARSLRALDAPVTGGDIGAQRAQLSIMVGGERADFDAMEPLFRTMGTAVHQGPAGFGQHAKLTNQIAIAGTILGVSEALGYAMRAGLDGEKLLQSISRGAAGSALLVHAGPRMLAGDFAPGFYVKHFIKDLGLALESARELGLDARGTALVKELYDRVAAMGHADDGTQALFRLFRP